MSTSDFNDRLKRGWRKTLAKSTALITSGNAFFSQVTGKMIDVRHGREDKEDRCLLPPETRIFSAKSLAMQNGVAFDAEGSPIMVGPLRSMKAGKSSGRMKSFKRIGSTNNSPFQPFAIGEKINEHPSFSFRAEPNPIPNWWAEPSHNDDYIAIYIRDARGLAVKELHHMSSSTFVRIKILNRGPDGVIKTHEANTRTVHHTRNPFYGQLFFFPLSLIRPDTVGTIAVLNSGVVDGFAGEVTSTFDHFLSSCGGPMENLIQWYKLQKKKSSDKVAGELCMLMSVVPARIYSVLQWSESPSTLLDPQILNALLAQYTLRMHLEQIFQIRFIELVRSEVEDIVKRLQIQARVGRSVITIKAQPKDVVYGQELSEKGRLVTTASISLDEMISIPLTSSFDVAFNVMTKKRQRDEIGDIRIYVMDGKREILFKAQIPIWEVGLKREMCSTEDDTATLQSWEHGRMKSPGGQVSWLVHNIDTWLRTVADEAQKGSPLSPAPASGSAPGERSPSPSPGPLQASVASEPDLRPPEKTFIPDLTGVAMTRAFARPVPSNKGFLYKRLAESYAFELVEGYPEVQVALVLIPTSNASQVASEAKVEDNPEDSSDEEEEAKVEEAAPITLPPSLPVSVCEVVVGGGPLSVFDTIFKQESVFRVRQAAQEGLSDLVLGPWEGSGSEKERKVTYVRPISIPLPMAPKKCNVNEIHKMKVREAGGFVIEVKVSTDAPKGDTFFVLIQYAGCSDGSNTKLRVSFQVEFIKPAGFLKGAIEGGALSSTKKLLQAATDALVAEMAPKMIKTAPHVRGTGLVQPTDPSGMTVSSDSIALSSLMTVKAQDPSMAPQWLKSFSAVWKDGAGDLMSLLLALVIVYVLWCISGDLRSLSRSMKRIEASMPAREPVD